MSFMMRIYQHDHFTFLWTRMVLVFLIFLGLVKMSLIEIMKLEER